MQYLWNIVQLSAHLRIYCHRFSLNSISTIHSSWLALSPFLALNRSSSLATGAATSTICPKASPSLLAPFRRTVISSVNTGFTFRWTYPRLLQFLHSRSVRHLHKFPAGSCAYATRLVSDTLHLPVQHAPDDK